MPKRPPRNAFYFFMLDYKEKPGNKMKSLKEVAEAAGPHWKNMSADQRRVYEQRAQKERSNQAKLNSDRLPIDKVQESERGELEQQHHMRDGIQAIMSLAKKRNTLHTEFFFIIHFNSFCHHDEYGYSPCEVAIAGFSLSEGVLPHNVYHSEIKSGPLPIGYAHVGKQHAEETHKMELPRVGEIDNQESVFKEIIEFLSSKQSKASCSLPALYAAQKDLPMVNSILETWCDQFHHLGVQFENFDIYNLQYMLKSLRNAVAKNEVWTSDTMSFVEIEKDVYNYTSDIACRYHQYIDSLVFCSRAIVVRYAYIVCDNCCKDANIEIVPGLHVPSNCKVATEKAFKTKTRSKRNYTSSSVRDDTSDLASVSLTHEGSEWSDATSSTTVAFPELKHWRSDRHSVVTDASYLGALTNSSPYNIHDRMSGMGMSQESMEQNFPPLNAGAGLFRGRGRGRPFRNMQNGNN